jgi:hypothetical protein
MPARTGEIVRTPGTTPTTMSRFDSARFDFDLWSAEAAQRSPTRSVSEFTAGLWDTAKFDIDRFGPSFSMRTDP